MAKRSPAAAKRASATPRRRATPRRAAAESSCPMIGVGASAGGLEALGTLLAATPARVGAAIVLVPHLAPTGKSLLVELLSRKSALPIETARHGTQPQADHVYVVRPNRLLTLQRGRFHEAPRPAHGLPLPIDVFFRSLAEACGPRGAGIVLSGTGSDGTLGLGAIRAAGGLTVAQAEASARYHDMPHSAIASGMVDHVLPVGDMPALLLAWVGRRLPDLPLLAQGEAPAGDLTQILTLLRAGSGHDFSHYKPNTVARRIAHRMQLLRLDRLADYLARLREHPAEADLLFKDLLIGVTRFFRDPEAFAALEHVVIPPLFAGRSADRAIRVWVPGCASGEEAYSIAMLLLERRNALGSNVPIKIFATDIDEDALSVARAGRYPDAIAADVGAERLARFFQHEGETYRVAKAVRELVVFAPHSLIKDPPFSRLDLISCRNVLIYLDSDLQQRVLPLLHSALTTDGVLFLGPSETLGPLADRFVVVDRKAKLFRPKAQPAHLPRLPLSAPGDGGRPLALGTEAVTAPENSLARIADRLLLEHYAPACAVIDARFDVVLFRGRTGRFLEAPDGVPDVNILRMARPGLTRKLRAALLQAARRQQPVLTRDVRVRANGSLQRIDLMVRPLSGAGLPAGQFLIVIFDEGSADRGPQPPTAAADADPGMVRQLEEELQEAREGLQSRVEELETANEELKSANEELLSLNEEHQSTNEELETVREELQSVNEELESVNAELSDKIDQLTRANSEVQNLLDATQIAAVFLDQRGAIRSFTPANTALFNLRPSDVGRPLTDIAPRVEYADLAVDVAGVLRTLETRERELHTADDRWFMMRMLPYRTIENVIDGVVLTFVEVSAQKRAEAATQQARLFAEAIVATAREPLLILDGQLRVHSANAAYYRAFDAQPTDTDGAPLFALGGGRFDLPALRELLQEVLPRDAVVESYALDCVVPGLGRRRLLLNARRLVLPATAGAYILLAIQDTGPAN